MAQIIKIKDGIVYVGMPTGQIIEVKRTSIDFEPQVGVFAAFCRQRGHHQSGFFHGVQAA